MSLEFSRRSFLKYTAVAAVAVAGSSLLTGCNDDDKTTRTGFGELKTLQNTADLSDATVGSDKNITFTFSVENGHGNSMGVTANCFEVTVTHSGASEYYFRGHSNIHTLDISSKLLTSSLEKGDTASGTLTTVASGSYSLADLKDGDTIVFTYRPYPEKYNKYRAQWTLTVKADSTTGKLTIS